MNFQNTHKIQLQQKRNTEGKKNIGKSENTQVFVKSTQQSTQSPKKNSSNTQNVCQKRIYCKNIKKNAKNEKCGRFFIERLSELFVVEQFEQLEK